MTRNIRKRWLAVATAGAFFVTSGAALAAQDEAQTQGSTETHAHAKHHSKLKGAAVGGLGGAAVGGKKGAAAGAAGGALVQHHRNKKAQKKAASGE